MLESIVILIGLSLFATTSRAEEMAVASPVPTPQEIQTPDPKGPSTKEFLTDAAIVATLIRTSRRAYQAGARGTCGCPDDVDRAGHPSKRHHVGDDLGLSSNAPPCGYGRKAGA